MVNQPAIGQEHRRFWCYLDQRSLDQQVLGITQYPERILILPGVLANRRRRLIAIGIDQPKVYTFGTKVRVQPLDFWRVTVGDRTVRADKNEDNRFGTHPLERIDPFTGQVGYLQLIR